MRIEGHFHAASSTISYLIVDECTLACAIVDSVLDYDAKSSRLGTASADRLIERVRELNAKVEWILETHVHADHISAATYLKNALGGKIAIGSHITSVLKTFGPIFNTECDFPRGAFPFDRLLEDEETFRIGSLDCRVLHTPGHTPACVTFVVNDESETVAFVGDTLFMPDFGTARCDFPGGDPRTLYRSAKRILSLPAATKLYTCHDYQPGGRELRYCCTVSEERESNIHVGVGVREEEFVAMRKSRDTTLDLPALMLPSVQINLRAGQLPPPEDNGMRYIRIPLNVF